MYMKWILTIALLSASFFTFADEVALQDQKTQAMIAGKAWLALIDVGDYETAYNQMATFAKERCSFNQFEEGALLTRRSLGSVQARTEISSELQAMWSNAPAGQYAVILFNTSFLGSDGALETFAKEQLVMKLSPTNEWQPVSYSIN